MITFEQGLSITGVAPFLGIVDAVRLPGSPSAPRRQWGPSISCRGELINKSLGRPNAKASILQHLCQFLNVGLVPGELDGAFNTRSARAS